MKWSFKFLPLAGIAVLILSCANPDSKNIKNQEKKFSLEQLKWLPGKWVNITDEFEFYETWESAGNTRFTGESYMLIDGDTVFYEVMRLEESNDSVKYIVGVAGQNNGMDVSFGLVSTDDNTFTFSNPQHDYPQAIVYRYVAPDSLYAYIEGEIDGQYHREDFVMVREK